MARRHGWGGDPPADDDEARARIVAAAMRSVDRQGAMAASLSDVATELGVTRQTVYRYFPSTDDLFSVLAQVSADDFIDRIAARMGAFDDVAEAMVEGLAFTIESVPHERYVGLLLRAGSAEAFTRGIVSEVATRFGRSLLDRTDIDWRDLGYDDADLDGLVEIMLRLIQSLALTPASPSGADRGPDELRAFLRRWFAPAVTAADPVPARG